MDYSMNQEDRPAIQKKEKRVYLAQNKKPPKEHETKLDTNQTCGTQLLPQNKERFGESDQSKDMTKNQTDIITGKKAGKQKTEIEQKTPSENGIAPTNKESSQRLLSAEKKETLLMASNAPYPSIDEVESPSTFYLDSVRTQAQDQINYLNDLIKQEKVSPIAAVNACSNRAKDILESIRIKVDIYKAYRGK